MKRHIHRLAACIITLALLLGLCPVMGSAAFAGEDHLSVSEPSAKHSVLAGSQPMQAASAEEYGTLEISVQIEGARSASLSTKTFTVNVTDPYGYTDQYNVTCDIPTDELVSASTVALKGLFPGEYTVSLDRSGIDIDGNVLSGVSGEGSVTVVAGTTSSAYMTVSYQTTVAVEPEVTPPPKGSISVYLSVQGLPQSVLSGKQYTVTIAGAGTSKDYSLDCSGGSGALTLMNSLDPGEYTVDESRASAEIDGYTLEVWGESAVTVEAGGDASVSIINVYTAVVPETTPPQEVGGTTEEPAPTPENTPTPEETPEPTSTPIPYETPEPTPEPTVEPTVEPTPEPTPSATPEPTPTSTPTPTPTPTPVPDVTVYIDDRDEYIELPVHLLDEIEDVEDAVAAVQELTDRLTEEQKLSHTAIDIATLFAERAAALTAVVDTDAEDELLIDAALLHHVEDTVKQAVGMVGEELENNGVDVDRKLPKTIILYVGDRTSFVAKIDPDVLDTDVDKVRVETDRFAITFKLDDLEADLADLAADETLRFKAEEVQYTAKPSSQNDAQPCLFPMEITRAGGSGKLAVKLTMPESGITNPITLSLESGYSEKLYETMMLDQEATPSKYNPVTVSIDSKTTTSGTYTTETNEVNFTDIADKSAEMQEAIKNLASRGVLVGTTATTFSPDNSISRAEIATLLVRVLGLYDERAIADYSDVTRADWYYVGAASSQKAKLMSGFGDGMFHGLNVITKAEIIAAGGNVLIRYMDYETPSNLDLYLGRFSDGVPNWGRESIAVATQENVVVYRTDGLFLGESDMTRGDAAIVIDRLFRRIW